MIKGDFFVNRKSDYADILKEFVAVECFDSTPLPCQGGLRAWEKIRNNPIRKYQTDWTKRDIRSIIMQHER